MAFTLKIEGLKVNKNTKAERDTSTDSRIK